MPWESWNARDAAWLRIERASARTMEEEIAARWWGKKNWGEARPSPYTVESTPSVPCVALASSLRRRITAGERAPVDSVALRQRVAVVAGRGVDPANPRATVERRIGGQAHGLLTEDDGAQPLERIAEREGVAVGGGRPASVRGGIKGMD